MPFKTKDGFSGIRENEEGTNYIDGGSLANEAGQVRYTSNRFSFFDGIGEYDPRSGGALPTPTELGQFLYSWNGVSFLVTKPLISDDGFIVTGDDANIVVAE